MLSLEGWRGNEQRGEGQEAYMCIDYTSDNRCSDIVGIIDRHTRTELPTQCTSAEPVDC